MHMYCIGVDESILHGHPQCLRNVITVGFPSGLGNGSCADDGAASPMMGSGLMT